MSSTCKKRGAYSLVELLVVMTIISILVGLLLPAVQGVREAARRTECANHLRQKCIANHNFESAMQFFPSSFDTLPNELVRGSWSIHAKILPFLESGNVFEKIDFRTDWHSQVTNGVPAFAVTTYSCPSDFNAGLRYRDGAPYVHSTSYGYNMGSWLVFDPVSQRRGDGAFLVSENSTTKRFLDGLSQTMCATDVKSFTSYIRNSTFIDPTLPDSSNHFEGELAQTKLGPALEDNTGHTVWCDGRVHHAGFTTVFAPNTFVSYSYHGRTYDINFSSQQEGRDLERPTYAAVTARSYHPGGVNSAMMDGAVNFVADGIDLKIWRAMGTAFGDEFSISRP